MKNNKKSNQLVTGKLQKSYIFKSLVRFTGLFAFMVAVLLNFTACGSEEDMLLVETEATTEIESREERETERTEENEPAGEETLLIVHVCGQVVNPGVYELPLGSRVIDGVNMAGGFTDKASPESTNLAAVLEDGIKLYIPSAEEIGQGDEIPLVYAETNKSTGANDGLVNINKADIKELTSLPGIGETRAGAIIEYRDANGPFKSIEDLKKVSGIGDASFEKLKDKIRV